MVEISHKVTISYNEEKAITVSPDLIKSFQNQQYLHLKATCYPIVQLLTGQNLPRMQALPSAATFRS